MPTKTLLAAALAPAALTAFLAFGTTVHAQDFYVGASGLGVFLEDSDIDSPIGDFKAEFDTGYGVRGFAGGTVWSDLIRLEVEGSYRRNDIDKLSNGASIDADGKFEAIAGMLNAYYDLDFIPLITPYIGGGVGAAYIKADVDFDAINLDDEDTVFAYQLAAGLSLELLPLVTLFGGYRYFATLDPEFEAAGTSFDAQYESHNVELGFRLDF